MEDFDLWGPPYIQEEDPNEWKTNFNFWRTPDLLEEAAMNKKYCLEVLKRLAKKADVEETLTLSLKDPNHEHEPGDQSLLDKEPSEKDPMELGTEQSNEDRRLVKLTPGVIQLNDGHVSSLPGKKTDSVKTHKVMGTIQDATKHLVQPKEELTIELGHSLKGEELEGICENDFSFLKSLLDLAEDFISDETKPLIKMNIPTNQTCTSDGGSSNLPSSKRKLTLDKKKPPPKKPSPGKTKKKLSFGIAGSSKKDKKPCLKKLSPGKLNKEVNSEIGGSSGNNDLESMSKTKLYAMAKEKNLRGYSKMRKEDIIKLLMVDMQLNNLNSPPLDSIVSG